MTQSFTENPYEHLLVKGWKQVDCADCSGYGVVSDYSYNDFEGAKDCPTCKGNCCYWVTPKGRIVEYPGGPFLGRV
mgnify:CR=1 FL=1